MISPGDAVLRGIRRLSLLGQTETKLDYVSGTHYSKDHGETLAGRSIQVEAWRSRHHARVWIHQRHRYNIPFFFVRTHSDALPREMEEQSFIGKAIPDRAGSCEKLIQAQRAGIIELAGVLARRLEPGRRNDAALRK